MKNFYNLKSVGKIRCGEEMMSGRHVGMLKGFAAPSARMIGGKVEIKLLNGSLFFGVLKETREDEVVLKSDDGEIVIFKHAIAYMIRREEEIDK